MIELLSNHKIAQDKVAQAKREELALRSKVVDQAFGVNIAECPRGTKKISISDEWQAKATFDAHIKVVDADELAAACAQIQDFEFVKTSFVFDEQKFSELSDEEKVIAAKALNITYHIDKKRYDKLSSDDKQLLANALEIKPALPKIKYERVKK